MFFLLKFFVFMFFNTASAMWTGAGSTSVASNDDSYNFHLSFLDSPTTPNPSYQSLPFELEEGVADANGGVAFSYPMPNTPGGVGPNLGGTGNQYRPTSRMGGLKFHNLSANQVKNIGKRGKFTIVSATQARGNKDATEARPQSDQETSGTTTRPVAFHNVSQEEAANGDSRTGSISYPKNASSRKKRPSGENALSPSKRPRTTSNAHYVYDEDYWFCPLCHVGFQRNSLLHINHQNNCSFKPLKSTDSRRPYPQGSSAPEQYLSSFHVGTYETVRAQQDFEAEVSSSLDNERGQQSSSQTTTMTSLLSPEISHIMPPQSPSVMNYHQEIPQSNVPEIMNVGLQNSQGASNERVVELATIGHADSVEYIPAAPEIPRVQSQPGTVQASISASLVCGYPTKESADGIAAPCNKSFLSQDERMRHIGEFHVRTCHWFICPHGTWEKCLEGPFAHVDGLKKHVVLKHIKCSSENIHH